MVRGTAKARLCTEMVGYTRDTLCAIRDAVQAVSCGPMDGTLRAPSCKIRNMGVDCICTLREVSSWASTGTRNGADLVCIGGNQGQHFVALTEEI